jgi:hypothetical protein
MILITLKKIARNISLHLKPERVEQIYIEVLSL